MRSGALTQYYSIITYLLDAMFVIINPQNFSIMDEILTEIIHLIYGSINTLTLNQMLLFNYDLAITKQTF